MESNVVSVLTWTMMDTLEEKVTHSIESHPLKSSSHFQVLWVNSKEWHTLISIVTISLVVHMMCHTMLQLFYILRQPIMVAIHQHHILDSPMFQHVLPTIKTTHELYTFIFISFFLHTSFFNPHKINHSSALIITHTPSPFSTTIRFGNSACGYFVNNFS